MKQLVRDIHPKPNIEEPRWDQSTYWNRSKHFFITTNPLNLFCTNKQLCESKRIVENYRKGEFNDQLTLDELWRAKQIYDSTFHPDTKEKMFIVGRMSAQVPANMVITGMMMTFYNTPAVVFWQWFNQSFNALVNYTNRSGDSPVPVSQLALSYVGATGGALITALGLNSLVKSAPPLINRLVPLCAVAAANCINIPLMRFRELQYGVSLFDSNGTKVGQSTVAAQRAIAMVTLSRILMAVPGMSRIVLDLPYRFMNAPIQVLMVGFFLTFATPLCCALFPQKSSIAVSELEPSLQERISRLPHHPELLYFNKGL
ncbi:sideroflexin 1 [Trichuris trichiura]|uniref:Sidoreflexin n=1 Tax=Trichuris trichiura TaxID=36087 RepID=A0A077Z7B0_TRITR|nr:sideroflexin 1 [Trichuris trichiura]